jgi:hypothetical protein
METIQFECGNCHNLLAVEKEFLGQQVCCPHCQQTVVTPRNETPQPIPTTEPAVDPSPFAGFSKTGFPTSRSDDQEDIFSPPGESDDLFGQATEPRLQLPAPTNPTSGADSPDGILPSQELAAADPISQSRSTDTPYSPPAEEGKTPAAQESPAPATGGDERFAWTMSGEVSAPAESISNGPAVFPTEAALGDSGAADVEASPRIQTAEGSEIGALPEPSVSPARRTARAGGSWFIPLVFVPLVVYAVGATALVGWSIYKINHVQEQQNPFEQLPDDGDDAGVTKNRRKIIRQFPYTDRFATLPLSADQRLGLNDTRRFGVLEVTPLRVERKRIAIIVGTRDQKAEPCRYDSLVLHLKLRNVSADQSFTPLDNNFDRQWKPGAGVMPLTYLEANGHRFFGPAKWVPSDRRNRSNTEYIEGRALSDQVGLEPNEQAESFVCTDGDDEQAARLLFGGHKAQGASAPCAGPFLWRVRLRRGLIEWRGKEHSATTVIGVEFTRSDIRQG